MLPFAIRFAVVADPALHAVAAVIGPEQVTLGLSPITWFGILVAFGVALHEVAKQRFAGWYIAGIVARGSYRR